MNQDQIDQLFDYIYEIPKEVLEALPNNRIEFQFDGYGDDGSFIDNNLDAIDNDLLNSIMDILYYSLPDGWELNDGSFGTIIIDLSTNKIKIEYNQRYMETDYEEFEY